MKGIFFAILAACAILETTFAEPNLQEELRSIKLTEDDKEAIARVAFSEAANQGDSGLAGVVYIIINRLINARFDDSTPDLCTKNPH